MRTGITTIGEAMVVLLPEDAEPLRRAERFGSGIGGAEFNVATATARLGVPTSWVSRLGVDGFGDRVLDVARAAGVDVGAVERDPDRPTGLYVKERVADPETGRMRSVMYYYRAGSAAAAMDRAFVERALRADADADGVDRRIVHTSGITAALSPTAAEACAHLAGARAGDLVSVDLNYRPRLWTGRSTAPLDALAQRADILFAGRDEAESYYGHSDVERIFAVHPRLAMLVVKDEANRASLHRPGRAPVHVPGLRVDVAEPVGAGDAFAAGFLSALALGREPEACLRLGHAVAATALIAYGDRPAEVPSESAQQRITSTSEAEWSTWHVAPGELPWDRVSVS